jgi:O-antigen ligase
VQDSARRSTMSRRALLLRGAVMTAKHPVFGVGMGNFAPASNENLKTGQRMDWGVSHNSYVQISSETGIPGLLFYGLAMAFSWFRTRAIKKRAWVSAEWAELARIALGLRAGMLGLFILMFFGCLAYDFYFPCFAGLAVALEWSARNLMKQESVVVPYQRVAPPQDVKPRLPRGHQPLPV